MQLYPTKMIDPALIPYEQDFFSRANKYCKPGQYFTPIQKYIYFQDLPVNQVAYCQTNHLTSVKMVFNTYYWNMATEDMKFATFVHEAMHCYFSELHSVDPNHFMFDYENYIPRAMVEQQLDELLKKKCH